MLVTLDLTVRQAARVLAQAVHTHAKLEIEPRPETHSHLLWGSLTGRQQDQLLVDLHDAGRDLSLAPLIGAMCDVRSILSGQLCMFSTFIVDALENSVPQRLTLAVPASIQIANRRRFARKTPTEPVPLRLLLPGCPTCFVAILTNISPQGLACRVVSRELNEVLYIGDAVRLDFALPWSNEAYSLQASVCSKNPAGEEDQQIVGFEFARTGQESLLDRLAQALADETARLIEKDGAL